MKDHAKATGQVVEPGQATDSIKGRPEFLPPPTEVPLRHCKHNPDEAPLSQAECLLDLVAGQPRGNEQPKNKQHFVLATADPSDKERKGKGYVDLREQVRQVPGVPIVYVKRSVMVLEELSSASERVKRGVERERLREGLVLGTRKRKSMENEEEDEDGDADQENGGGVEAVKNLKVGKKREKGPNPLSVRKKKVRVVSEGDGRAGDDKADEAAPKATRRRKHHSRKAVDDDGEAADTSASTNPAQESTT